MTDYGRERTAARTSRRASQNHRPAELRVPPAIFARVRAHVEDLRRGEEAGFLLCGVARLDGSDLLLAREWIPIPEEAITDRGHSHGLAWTPAFNACVLERADALRAALVLVHAHPGDPRPRLSPDDERSADRLFPAVSRILPGPSGTVVLGRRDASGRFWSDGRPSGALSRLRVIGVPLEDWVLTPSRFSATPRPRLDRQSLAIGPQSDALLAQARVAVVGVCGGGSHVCQQLAHFGVGHIVPVDDEYVGEENLSRMVGAHPADVGRTYKTAVMRRLIRGIDPSTRVTEVRARFPSPEAIEALKQVNVVVACVDSLAAREQINAFCRRHHVPLVDIGMTILTEGERLRLAHGQLVVVTPGSACLRCGPLLSDVALERERAARPPGYDRSPEALGDPQVVSMNGVLASEAANSILNLITGYAGGARGAGWWSYDGRRGALVPCALPPCREGCPACAEQGHGDSNMR